MKNVFALGLIAFLASCGGGGGGGGSAQAAPCANLNVLGMWEPVSNPGSSILEVFDNCTATESFCQQEIEFGVPDPTTSITTFNVKTSNGNTGCLAAGQYTCSIALNVSNNLFINCGAPNQFAYQRP